MLFRSIERAKEMLAQNTQGWMPMQFENTSNVKVHKNSTAIELLNDFPGGIDYLITGVGTGGHITGCAEVLKAKFPKLKVLAVEPSDSAVLSGGKPGPHALQGLGAGFVPAILNTSLIDGIVQVQKEEAYEFAKNAAKKEGILLGVSSGASLAAVEKSLDQIPDGAVVVTFCYDTGERYFSVAELF